MHGLSSFRRRVANALRSGRRPASQRHPDAHADPVVADLARKLRAGFSRYARKDLDDIVRYEAPDGRRRTLAAWELAKFHAAASQWDRVLYYLENVHEAHSDLLDLCVPDRLEPDPGPAAPARGAGREHYDLVVVSDLTLLGGTRRCNEGYLAAAARLGMRAGLFHWPRYDLRLKDDIAKEYRALSEAGNVDILAPTDRLSADLLLIHHPPILKYVPDTLPSIDAKSLAILVNQLPRRCGEDGAYYDRGEVEAFCSATFGMPAVWIPISPVVRRVLTEEGFAPLANEDWIPPLGNIVPAGARPRVHARPQCHPVVGRHSRDHWTKWPEAETDLRRAYCADSPWPVRFLGGASAARRVLTRWPANWTELPFDSMAVGDFLDELDFFVHFTHSAYVEEFGRNVMEAMAAGKPVVVPPRFREVFGDAASYAEPEQVEDVIRALWDAESARTAQVEKGLRFVAERAGGERVERRLEAAVRGTL